ncbi:MAG: ribonuclease R [Candidatus Neomarinimicrobiota bacterium]
MKNKSNLEQNLLEYIKSHAAGSFRQRDLVQQLKVAEQDINQLSSLLQRFTEEGLIGRVKRGLYKVKLAENEWEGKLVVNQKGFGFVISDTDRPDIFVGRRQMGNAVHGDWVRVRVKGRLAESTSGAIDRVIWRGTDRFVGTVYRENSSDWLAVQPLTPARGIKILAGGSIKYTPGLTVVAVVKDWGSQNSPITVVITKIIGAAGDPMNDLAIILSRYGYDTEFPAKVLTQTQGFSEADVRKESKQRQDFRDLLTVTIDPETARDFDDALSIEESADGYQLSVHIADVSHFIPVGSPLDREALNRGTSVYFTEGTVPMLPEALSGDLCSLKPGVDRLTLTARIKLSRKFAVTGFEVVPAVINSDYRFTYRQVQEILDGRSAHPVRRQLLLLLELSRFLHRQRSAWGSIDFDIPESIFTLSPEGIPREITTGERLDSHRLVEECMLLANRLVAERIPGKAPNQRPFLYRIHDQPESTDVVRLLDLLRRLKIYHGTATDELTSAQLRDIIAGVEQSPYKYLVENIALRSMTKAVYLPVNRGHFGLAFRAYTHFTSPIRRYPDLVVHRLIKQYYFQTEFYLKETLPPVLSSVCEAAVQAELKALQAEREYTKIKQLRWLQEHLGETFEGIISGVIQFGFFVELADTLVEGLVHVETLTADDFSFDEEHYCLTGRRSEQKYCLGLAVRIKVQEVLLDKVRANFILAD